MENGDIVPIINRMHTACYENPLFEEDGAVRNETHTKLHNRPDGLKSKPYDLNNAAQTSVHYRPARPRRRWLYCLGIVFALLAIIGIIVAVIVGQRRGDGSSRGGETVTAQPSTNKVFQFRTERVEGRVRIIQGPFSSYQPQYSNKSSTSFQLFSSSFTYQISVIFTRSSYSSSYSHTEVVNISSGSVIVGFIIHFKQHVDIFTNTRYELIQLIRDGLEDSLYQIDTSSIVIQPKDPSLSVIPTSEPGVCVAIKSQHCAGVVDWSSTTLPNILGHRGPAEVAEAEVAHEELFYNSCGRDFWCSAFYPRCWRGAAVPPCRSYCETVYQSCRDTYQGVNIDVLLVCASLPESSDPNVCQKDPFEHGKCMSKGLEDKCKAFGYSEMAFPNFAGQRNRFAALDLMMLIEGINNATHCYKYSVMFACYTMMPKCSGRPFPNHAIPPCRSLCNAYKSRCSIFLDIFFNPWPENLFCDSFPDSSDKSVCLGFNAAHEPPTIEECPAAESRCDNTTCFPPSWRCDGFQDCLDGTDEAAIQTEMPLRKCVECPADMFRCSVESAVCVEAALRCDGVEDCPTGADERDCLALGDEGDSAGVVNVYSKKAQWGHVCKDTWTSDASSVVCQQLGYHTPDPTMETGVPSPTSGNLFSVTTLRNGSDPQYLASRLEPVPSCPGGIVVRVTCGNPVCGLRPAFIPLPTRIVGGDVANPNAWPWHVSVFGGTDQKYFCGGTIIDKHWILTAGHCIGGRRDVSNLLLRAGQPRRDTFSAYTQELYPAELILHPGYNPHTVANDIALIRLHNHIRFNDHVRPTCLPSSERKLPIGTRCTVLGWGKQGDTAPNYERQIRQVNLEVTDWHSCKAAIEGAKIKVPYQLTDQMFCAGGGIGHDSCSGDSGGPFMCPLDRTNDTWYVAGIVSWGVACAYPNVPGVYTNVPGYLDWIRNMTGLDYL
ncbi:atrial natriuretic peptide-converting enzyme-like isoform X2 [Mya arenaria]|uniref:atrial natriuretic peptide-converting enzyme-like isoform X2 n=1 Tax=Mya arenaria TaxID=6604 RepID=UPI0022E414E8|nr:atrial natriuretic peptide-converting enzyme-like isoform X2 [Mya arenaria]